MTKRIICLFGPQGSGKGTQAKILTAHLHIPHISTGDLFRAAIASRAELGKQVEGILNKGELVSDELTFNLLKERISQNDCKAGFILDGYPRTLTQAQLLDDFMNVDVVIVLEISDAESLKRLTNRRQDSITGAIYNLYTVPKPPKEIERRLIQRADDTAEAIEKRLKKYHQQTEPLFLYYKNKVIRVNGEQSIERVAGDIERALVL